ncbi:MAG: hypothetical protein LBM87_06150 [Ruminococcus sp.]|jgi:hypothetical protein|nr:hypothetical protein [Ruminococcus sp.]
MRISKKFSFIKPILALTAVLVFFSACGDKTEETTESTTSGTETKAVVTDENGETKESIDYSVLSPAYPKVSLRQSGDELTAEIIKIGYDEGKRPNADKINKDIERQVESVLENYQNEMELSNNNTDYYYGALNLYAYSITDENFIQIYHTAVTTTEDSTDMKLFGYIYDIPNDGYLKPEDFYKDDGYSNEKAVLKEAQSIWESENPEYEVGETALKTVNLTLLPEENYYTVTYLFEMELTDVEYDENYKGFYQFSPDDQTVYELDPECILDPYVFDEYDNPLHYQDGYGFYEEPETDYTDDTDDTDYTDDTEYTDDTDDTEYTDDEEYDVLVDVYGDFYKNGSETAESFYFYGSDVADLYNSEGEYIDSYTLEFISEAPTGVYEYNMLDASGVKKYSVKINADVLDSIEVYDTSGKLYGKYSILE